MTDMLTLRQFNPEIMALCFSVVVSFSLVFDCCVLLSSVEASCVCCVCEWQREEGPICYL